MLHIARLIPIQFLELNFSLKNSMPIIVVNKTMATLFIVKIDALLKLDSPNAFIR